MRSSLVEKPACFSTLISHHRIAVLLGTAYTPGHDIAASFTADKSPLPEPNAPNVPISDQASKRRIALSTVQLAFRDPSMTGRNHHTTIEPPRWYTSHRPICILQTYKDFQEFGNHRGARSLDRFPRPQFILPRSSTQKSSSRRSPLPNRGISVS